MALVVRTSAEALLANGEEATVFDRAGAAITEEDHCVDQDNGYVTMGQMVFDVLDRHGAADGGRQREGDGQGAKGLLGIFISGSTGFTSTAIKERMPQNKGNKTQHDRV